jgi:hypothetical protein
MFGTARVRQPGPFLCALIFGQIREQPRARANPFATDLSRRQMAGFEHVKNLPLGSADNLADCGSSPDRDIEGVQ